MKVIRLGVSVLLSLTLLLIPVSYFADGLTSDQVSVHDPLDSGNLVRPTDWNVSGEEEVLPEDVSPDWWSVVQKSISDSEYEINWQEDRKCYSSPNRAQNLRFDYNKNGFTVSPRTDKPWTVQMTLSAVGKGELIPVIPKELIVDKNKAIGTNDLITVTYENTKEGMRQNFIVHEKPSGEGYLSLRIEVDTRLTFAAQGDGRGIGFTDSDGQLKYQYVGLKVTDANGRELVAGMQKEGNDLSIMVNDDGAHYPILVDPLSISADWFATGQAGSWFGWSVASAGDVNGDGYSDVIVGAVNYDNGFTNQGSAFLYYGSAGGLALSSEWSAEGDQANENFGYSVASAGDTNGDGYSDVIVGAPYYANGQTGEGRAQVYLGSADGLSLTPNWTAEGNLSSAYFGFSVASAGDVNGDGYSDVIVGSSEYTNGQGSEGRALVYHGSSDGLSVTFDWSAEGDYNDAFMGSSVGSAGDVNGDGYSDVIVGVFGYDNGQTEEGQTRVYHGSAGGLSLTANWSAESDVVNAQLGYSVAPAGDVNGDGYSDVIVGAFTYSNGQNNEGRASVYYGGAGGLLLASSWSAESDQINAQLGYTVASAGDVNGDGFSDVIVGAPYYDNGQTDEGRVFVYLGGAAGPSLSSAWSAESNLMNSYFGYSTASAGDVNGDGLSDVIVGARNYSSGAGRAYVYQGGTSGLSVSSNWTTESDQANAQFGTSVASAGDVNGDGFSDVIVGAPNFDNGQTDEGRAFAYHGSAGGLSLTAGWSVEGDQVSAFYGKSAASAGDINGDGYSDVIVGAELYDNGETNEGRAFVYHGSAGGLSLSSNWTAESNQAGAYFGTSVASAGDVNGDGYSDVVVGSSYFENGQTDEGRAFVFHGSPAGLPLTSNWTAEPDQTNTLYGNSVACAGDVNRDGYSDVIVGAPFFERAYVYHGGPSGLNSGANWTTSGDAFGRHGWSVASAGDVNGDGYSDVIVGAFQYANGETGEGRAYLFHGGTTGLSVTSNWMVEGNSTGAQLGVSVASAGDVNGDGYSDVIVGNLNYANGQANEGRALVYHGGASGVSLTPNWSVESDQVNARIGACVASAGDVNGDGYSDVIVGAIYYDNGQTDEGRAFMYYGNGGGVAISPRVFRSDLTTPIVIHGRTHSSSGAGAGVQAKTFMGRTDVKAFFETKPLGTPFDGGGLTESDWTDMGTITQSLDGLISGERYKLRLRLAYGPVLSVQPFGPWIYLHGNGGLGESDFLVSNVPDNEPDIQASNLSLAVPPEAESLTMQWTSGNGTSRLVVARAGFITASPVDGKAYSGGPFGAGSQLSPGQFVVYNGNGNSMVLTGLSAGTLYYLRVFEYAGSSNLENYYTVSADNNPMYAYTLFSEPTDQAGNIVFSNVTPASMTLTWTNGDGNYRLLVGQAGSAVSSDPVDGTAYSGNPDFNSAAELIVGEKILHAGGGNSVNLINLTANTVYHFKVFEYNDEGEVEQINYLTGTDTGNPANRSTLVVEPSNQPTSIIFSAVTENATTISFTPATGAADGYLALVKAGSSPAESPVDGNAYTVGNMIGTSTVSYVGNATSFPLVDLTANTVYHVNIFAYNGTTGTYNYLTTSALGGSQITTTLAPALNTPGSFGQSSFQLSWPAVTGATDYALDVSSDNFLTLVPGYDNKALGNVTSTSVTGLSTGATYKSRLRAINEGGASANSNEHAALTIPATPVLTVATATSSSSISISWDSLTGASGFLLDVSIDDFLNYVPGYNGLAVSGPISYTATGLNPLSTYQVRLRSQNASGTSPSSNVLSVLTFAVEPIAQPTALIFSNVTTTSLSASFTNASGSPAGYLVLFKSGSSPSETPVDGTSYVVGSTIGTSTVAHVGSSNTFSLTGLGPNEVYFFDLFSYNGSTGTYNYLVTSPLEGSRATSTTEPANQPINLAFFNVTSGGLDVSFTAVGPASGYLVLRKIGSASTEAPADGTEYVLGNVLGASFVVYVGANTSFTDTGLSPGTSYFYAVFAFNGSTNTYNYLSISPLQGMILTLPNAPVAKPPSNTTSVSFTANWDAATGAVSYEVDVSTDDFTTLLSGFPKTGITNTELLVDGLTTQTTYKYRVRAVNANGDKSANSNAVTATTSDSPVNALKINTAATVATFLTGSSARLLVNVTGGTGTKSVSLKHRGILSTTLPLAKNVPLKSADDYEVEITESMLDELGLEYFFEATDQSGTIVKQSSNSYLYKAIAAGSNAPAIPFAPGFNGKGSTYQMFSIPYRLTDENIANLFDPFLNGQDKTQWRLYHYQNGANAEYPDVVKKIELGKGYWFNTIISDVQIRLGQANVEHANQTTSFTMSLDQGWNQVGNPYPFNISWTSVLGSNDKVGELNFYSDGNYQTNDVFGDWTGAFVFADEATTLPVPVSAKTGSARMYQQELLPTLDDEAWMLPIEASINGLARRSGIGMHPLASMSKDKYDRITLPRFIDYVELHTNHQEFFSPRFSTDVVPSAADHSWLFEIETNQENAKGELTWDVQAVKGVQSSLVIIDLLDQTWVDMKTAGVYSFTQKEGRQFKVIYDRKGEIHPDLTLLGDAYPNPFSNEVTIPLLLGKEGMTLQIDIYNLLGQRVKTIMQSFTKAGLESVVWDGKDDLGGEMSTGMLLYRINNINGGASQVKRMIKK